MYVATVEPLVSASAVSDHWLLRGQGNKLGRWSGVKVCTLCFPGLNFQCLLRVICTILEKSGRTVLWPTTDTLWQLTSNFGTTVSSKVRWVPCGWRSTGEGWVVSLWPVVESFGWVLANSVRFEWIVTIEITANKGDKPIASSFVSTSDLKSNKKLNIEVFLVIKLRHKLHVA